MKGTIVVIVCLYLVKLSSAVDENNLITKDGQETPVGSPILESQPAQQMIAAIYRRATVQALQSKVSELHMKLLNGENAIPAAMEILKIALLSDPAQQQVIASYSGCSIKFKLFSISFRSEKRLNTS